jgi:polysaccharide pyruvyl transferase WcaK-like protein
MILLHGYYGERNAGDDAFVTVCAERFAAKGHAVRVLASELPRSAAPHAVPILLRRRWKGIAARVEHRRMRSIMAAGGRVVLGGGSLLRTTSGIAEVSHLLDMARGRGHAALGVSIGPWRDAGAAAACAALLPRFDFVGVRDEVSLRRARDIAPSARVELTFDLAPLLMPPPQATSRVAGSLGVALCGPVIAPDHLERISGMLGNWLRAEPGRSIVLLPFNVHPRKGDIALHAALASRLGTAGPVTMEEYRGDPRATWSRIGELQALVAMRLHAAIFGYASQTPTLLLPYEEKCEEWAAMSQHPTDFIRTVAHVTERDLERLVRTPLLPALSLDAARRAAARNFEAIGT